MQHLDNCATWRGPWGRPRGPPRIPLLRPPQKTLVDLARVAALLRLRLQRPRQRPKNRPRGSPRDPLRPLRTLGSPSPASDVPQEYHSKSCGRGPEGPAPSPRPATWLFPGDAPRLPSCAPRGLWDAQTGRSGLERCHFRSFVGPQGCCWLLRKSHPVSRRTAVGSSAHRTPGPGRDRTTPWRRF